MSATKTARVKKGREKDAERMIAYFKKVQLAKSEIGISLPDNDLPGFSEAWAGLTALEDGCRKAYEGMVVRS